MKRSRAGESFSPCAKNRLKRGPWALFGRRARRKWCWALVAGFVAGVVVVSTYYPPWARHAVARGDSYSQGGGAADLARTHLRT